jgi:hypothetical protein
MRSMATDLKDEPGTIEMASMQSHIGRARGRKSRLASLQMHPFFGDRWKRRKEDEPGSKKIAFAGTPPLAGLAVANTKRHHLQMHCSTGDR